MTRERVILDLPHQTWYALIGFSVIGVLAFYLVLYGYSKLEAQKASLIMLAELIFVIIVGYILYQEIPSWNVSIGGMFIVLALALPNIHAPLLNRILQVYISNGDKP
jgi:drug/metabolite transporter (DMT)-like permease